MLDEFSDCLGDAVGQAGDSGAFDGFGAGVCGRGHGGGEEVDGQCGDDPACGAGRARV